MLTFEERSRLQNSLPTAYDLTWDGTTYAYDFETWWEDESHTSSYPETILGWNQRSVADPENQSMNHVATDDRSGENVCEYTYATRLYDELSVTCLVEDVRNADGVPPKPRAEAFASTLRDYLRYDFGQNHVGADGERPVVARLSKEPAHDTRTDSSDIDIQEFEFRARVHYTEEHTETVDATEDVEYTVQTN